MMKIGENFIQICRAVFKISRQMLLPWQPNFVREKFVYFHITEMSPYSFGNFRKLSLYNCFMPI